MPTSIAAVPVPRRTGAERSVLLFLFVAGVFFWAAKYHPFVSSPRVIDDDARQHVYWTYTFQDRTLFRDDPLTDFVASPKVAPPGYQALYFVGARLMDPLLPKELKWGMFIDEEADTYSAEIMNLPHAQAVIPGGTLDRGL